MKGRLPSAIVHQDTSDGQVEYECLKQEEDLEGTRFPTSLDDLAHVKRHVLDGKGVSEKR